MSRVDSARLACEKAGDRAVGAACASDAFFLFADAVEVCLAAGVTAFVQPGGSRRDAEVIAATEAAGAAMGPDRQAPFPALRARLTGDDRRYEDPEMDEGTTSAEANTEATGAAGGGRPAGGDPQMPVRGRKATGRSATPDEGRAGAAQLRRMIRRPSGDKKRSPSSAKWPPRRLSWRPWLARRPDRSAQKAAPRKTAELAGSAVVAARGHEMATGLRRAEDGDRASGGADAPAAAAGPSADALAQTRPDGA